jgi:hypothetical protein
MAFQRKKFNYVLNEINRNILGCILVLYVSAIILWGIRIHVGGPLGTMHGGFLDYR